MENMQNSHHAGHASEHGTHNPKHASGMYKRFAVMAVAMFAVMYFIMYAMIDGWQNLIPNINNLYMTLLMTSAMLLIELAIMKVMYPNGKIELVDSHHLGCRWHLFMVWYQGTNQCRGQAVCKGYDTPSRSSHIDVRKGTSDRPGTDRAAKKHT
ncbi:Uncharacterised protein [Sphingobacterium multivorum]|uniref:Uncharacterized protein n=1 Tax=Sphingobacterium multivorum TaxID=28454 RepID=A0A2X2JXV3_SPHMU|nr:hypothetical protein [Sphingobacterium multivorum]SPZ92605.1 Uncharacterised protein [Sphingobacterium multivorum]